MPAPLYHQITCGVIAVRIRSGPVRPSPRSSSPDLSAYLPLALISGITTILGRTNAPATAFIPNNAAIVRFLREQGLDAQGGVGVQCRCRGCECAGSWRGAYWFTAEHQIWTVCIPSVP